MRLNKNTAQIDRFRYWLPEARLWLHPHRLSDHIKASDLRLNESWCSYLELIILILIEFTIGLEIAVKILLSFNHRKFFTVAFPNLGAAYKQRRR